MIIPANANELKSAEQFCNNIYEYDSETHSLRTSGSGKTKREASYSEGSGVNKAEDNKTMNYANLNSNFITYRTCPNCP